MWNNSKSENVSKHDKEGTHANGYDQETLHMKRQHVLRHIASTWLNIPDMSFPSYSRYRSDMHKISLC